MDFNTIKELLDNFEICIDGKITFNLKDSSIIEPEVPEPEVPEPEVPEPEVPEPEVPTPANKTTIWSQNFENTSVQTPYSVDQIKKDFSWETYKTGRNSYMDPNDYISIIEKDGKKVLKNSYGPGHWGVGLSWETGGNEGNGTGANIFSVMSKDSGWEELYLSYNIFFEEGFEWGHGGKMIGLSSLPTPKGLVGPEEDQGSNALMMWQADGKMKFYCYFHEDFEYQYGRGPVIPTKLKTGEWTNITIRIVNSSPWAKDGLMEIFVNGVLDMTWNNIKTREKEDILFNTLRFNTFQGGGDDSYATPGDCTSLIDGMEVFYLTGDSTTDTPIGKVKSQEGRDISEYLAFFSK